MTRALAVLVLVALPRLAAAGSRCPEVSSIVGHERCSRFGAWALGFMMDWELGATLLRYGSRDIAASQTVTDASGATATYHYVAAPGDARAVIATGGRLRALAGIGRTFYFGSQVDVATITAGPRLVTDVSARGATPMVASTVGGLVFQSGLVAGVHRRLGAVMLAAELDPAVRFAQYQVADLPARAMPPTDVSFALDVQPEVSYWLAPNWTVGVQAGIDLVHPDSVGLAVVLGGHLTPYDAAR